jgi:hypothetical protein
MNCFLCKLSPVVSRDIKSQGVLSHNLKQVGDDKMANLVFAQDLSGLLLMVLYERAQDRRSMRAFAIAVVRVLETWQGSRV